MTTNPDVFDLITRAGDGDLQAAESLMPEVYEALRALAHRKMASESADHTLQPTALVSEAYLRLVGEKTHDAKWNGKRHFYGAAAIAMRRILVDRARRNHRIKHGGRYRQVTLDEAHPASTDGDHQFGKPDILGLDDALQHLGQLDPRAAEIVMLKYFAGLPIADIAASLDVSERTIRREWNFAKVWLLDFLTTEQMGQTQ